MQTFAALSALAIYLCLRTCHADSDGLYIPPSREGSQEVVKLKEGTTYKPGDKEIKTKMSPNSNFETTFSCTETQGLQLTSTSSGKYVGCCLHDQILVGSEGTQFMCCGHDHIMAGNKEVGFSCCPTGNTFDGKVCHDPPTPEPLCTNGKTMVNGKCVCPAGTMETNGQCRSLHCQSDLSYGKCYMFKFYNGEFYGSEAGGDGVYYATQVDINHGRGVFTFCPDEKCAGTGPVGANDTFYIRDLRGMPASGARPNDWLSNHANGNHIRRSTDIKQAGKFTISKYPECGQFCLGGRDPGGVYYACPHTTPALAFWTLDPGVCVPIELMEVPCDYHEQKNNCAWDAGCDTSKRVAGPPTPPQMEL